MVSVLDVSIVPLYYLQFFEPHALTHHSVAAFVAFECQDLLLGDLRLVVLLRESLAAIALFSSGLPALALLGALAFAGLVYVDVEPSVCLTLWAVRPHSFGYFHGYFSRS